MKGFITNRCLILISILLLSLSALLVNLAPYPVLAESKDNSPPQQADPNSNLVCPPFRDVTDRDYFCWSLANLYNRGAVSGYFDSTFRPYNSVFRGEFSKMMKREFAWSTDLTGAPHFSDVAPGSAFYDDIETMVNRHIITGYGNPDCSNAGLAPPCFFPNRTITRQQMIKMVSNAAGFVEDTTYRTQSYYDMAPGTTFFSYIERSVMHSVASEYPSGAPTPPYCNSSDMPCFFPGEAVYRADAVVHIYNAYVSQVSFPPGLGQVFGLRKGDYFGVAANVTTPEYNSQLPEGQWIAAPVGISARYNPYYVEAGPKEFRDLGSPVTYNPYYSWHSQSASSTDRLTGVSITPSVSYNYKVVGSPGGQWTAYYCSNTGCLQLAVSDPLITTPYAAVGAETSYSTISAGTIQVSYFHLTLAGGSEYTTCYDPTRTPWRLFNGYIGSCNSSTGSWSISYVHP